MSQAKAPWTTMPGAKLKQKSTPQRLKAVKSSRAKELRAYDKARLIFLQRHRLCAVWQARNETKWPEYFGEALSRYREKGCPWATECHHVRGRAGKMLLDERYWLAVSREGHDWIRDNPKKAQELGLLAAMGEWGEAE